MQAKFLSVIEAAAKIGVSRQRVLQWIHQKRLAAIKVGNYWVIPTNECYRPPDMRTREWR